MHLIFIGDGPCRAALQAETQGLPVTFTGFLHGGELATALASCDVKVFPSTTDTRGQCSAGSASLGLPVIVTDIGGPAELLNEGETGLIVRGNDERAPLRHVAASRCAHARAHGAAPHAPSPPKTGAWREALLRDPRFRTPAAPFASAGAGIEGGGWERSDGNSSDSASLE